MFRLGGVVGGQVAVQRLQLLQQARHLRDLMYPGGAQLPGNVPQGVRRRHRGPEARDQEAEPDQLGQHPGTLVPGARERRGQPVSQHADPDGGLAGVPDGSHGRRVADHLPVRPGGTSHFPACSTASDENTTLSGRRAERMPRSAR